MQVPDADAAALLAAAAKRIFAVMVLILCYSLCSSMLLILNKVCSTTPTLHTRHVPSVFSGAKFFEKEYSQSSKNTKMLASGVAACPQVAVTYVPAPSFILALQLLSCAVFVRTLSAAGAVEAEPLTLAKARPFAVIVFGFIGTLYSNITSLKARASRFWATLECLRL